MHHPHEMANMHHIHNLPAYGRGLALRVAPFGYDAVKELASGAQFHDEVHAPAVLISPLEVYNVRLASQVLQDHHFSSHVLNVAFRHELPLGYRLACITQAGGPFSAQVRDTELPTAKLLLKYKDGGDIDHRLPEDGADVG